MQTLSDAKSALWMGIRLLLGLLLLVRPLGVSAQTLAAPNSRAPAATTAVKSVPVAAQGDDDADDDDDDDDDDSPATPAAKAAEKGATSSAKASSAKAESNEDDSDSDDDSDDDDDFNTDDYDYDDALDIAGAKEDAGKAISGNVTLASDYILRGLTQTDHQPAIQGGFDWTHPSGAYAGVWGSNVHFPGELPSMELDPYTGFGYRFAKNWRVSLGVDYLAYFENEGRNSWDFPARIEWKTFSLEADYSPRWAGLSGDSWYFLGGWSDTLWWEFTFGAYIGYSTFTAEAGVPNYWDFRVSVSHKVLQVDVGITGVFVSDQEINDANGGPRAIFSVSKTF